MKNYSADGIIINKRAELKQISEDKWQQVWDIVLKKPISKIETFKLENITLRFSFESYEEIFDFDVRIEIKEGKYLTVDVIFNRDTTPYHHDHSLFGIYQVFEYIEQFLGAIDTIEGQKIEERWSPFKRKSNHGNNPTNAL